MADPTYPERAITELSQDKFGRSPFVFRLTDALISKKSKLSTGVIVGLTGAWGSGKSSILNILKSHINITYPSAIVVSFDPWLVSGRNDLISEFMSELIRSIIPKSKDSEKLRKVASMAAKYGGHLAAAGNLLLPALGTALQGGLKAAENALQKSESLTELRAKLATLLADIDVPIVVLIDELDRIEDSEVRTVAQLVRSVADFPRISYILAYDTERVIQALGGGRSHEATERGRAYLEKIVQFNFPLPSVTNQELSAQLDLYISNISKDLSISDSFSTDPRYRELKSILFSGIVSTPRDLTRIAGTFQVIGSMTMGEVDWIDTLSYSTLLCKIPTCTDRLRRNIDLVVDNPESASAQILRAGSNENRSRTLEILLGDDFNQYVFLFQFMFPHLSPNPTHSPRHADSISKYRSLATLLRLGVPPHLASRTKLRSFMQMDEKGVAEELESFFANGDLRSIVSSLDETYSSLDDIDHVTFWKGVSSFFETGSQYWNNTIHGKLDYIGAFCDIITNLSKTHSSPEKIGGPVFRSLVESGDLNLAPRWIYQHIISHGLFGHRGSNKPAFLHAVETERVANQLSLDWRSSLLQGSLFPQSRDITPIYVMMSTQTWDDECRKRMCMLIEEPFALDAFSIAMFRGNHATGKDTVEKVFGWKNYELKAQIRVSAYRNNPMQNGMRLIYERALEAPDI